MLKPVALRTQLDVAASFAGADREKRSPARLPSDEWTSVCESERPTGELLDRLAHHVHML